MSDEPFGRQPKTVEIVINGEKPDVEFWQREFIRRAEFKGDQVIGRTANSFVIYPRAVND